MLDKAFHRLAWGYNAGLPERFVAAWGCRAIYNGDGLIDIVPDRQDWLGRDADRKVLLAVLRRSDWQATVRNRIPKLQPNVVQEFVAYDDGAVVVKVNTNASYGYLYVVGYITEQQTRGDDVDPEDFFGEHTDAVVAARRADDENADRR